MRRDFATSGAKIAPIVRIYRRFENCRKYWWTWTHSGSPILSVFESVPEVRVLPSSGFIAVRLPPQPPPEVGVEVATLAAMVFLGTLPRGISTRILCGLRLIVAHHEVPPHVLGGSRRGASSIALGARSQ